MASVVTLFRAFRPEELTHFLRFSLVLSQAPPRGRARIAAKLRFCSPRLVGGPIAKPLHRSRVEHDNGKTPTLREVARHIPRTDDLRASPSANSAHPTFVLLVEPNISMRITTALLLLDRRIVNVKLIITTKSIL